MFKPETENFESMLLKQHELHPEMQLKKIVNKINELLKSQDGVNMAIDGKSGSGKSTLADILAQLYDCNIFHMDDFFLRPELRTEERLKEVGGNVDYVRFKEEVINGILKGSDFKYQLYNCQLMSLTDFITATPKKLNIVEGVYSLHPTLTDYYDFKIYLDIDEEYQSNRILKRSGPFLHKRFIDEWIPKENQYFKEMKIKEKSDLVIIVK